MTRRIASVAGLARRFGPAQALTVVWLWAARHAFQYRKAIVYALDTARAAQPSACREFEWQYASADELSPALLSAAGLDSLSFAESACREGVCFNGSAGGTPCFFSMVSRRGFTIPDRISVTFPGHAEAYVGNCITLESFRGRGVYPCALAQLAGSLHSEGRRWLYLYVERENLASIRGVEKAGFRPIACCSIVRVGRFMRNRWHILAPARDHQAVRRWTVSSLQRAPLNTVTQQDVTTVTRL